MNPCRCGYLDDPALGCGRAPQMRARNTNRKFRARYSTASICHVDVPAVKAADLACRRRAEGSAEVAARVAAARARQQRERFAAPAERPARSAPMPRPTANLLEEIAAPDPRAGNC